MLEETRQQSPVRHWNSGLMMEALEDRVWFEGVFIGLGGVRIGGSTDSFKKFLIIAGS